MQVLIQVIIVVWASFTIEVAAPQCPKNDESKFGDMFNGFNGKSVILLDQVHRRVNEELKSSPFFDRRCAFITERV